jgi:outer membrane protein insertion porin family
LGKGYGVQFNTYLARRKFDIEVGAFTPYFMGRNIFAGCDVFFSRYRGNTRGTFDEGGYKQQSGGISFNANYPLNKNLYQNWIYKIRKDVLYFDKFMLSPYIVENMSGHERQWVSSIGHEFIYSKIEKSPGIDPFEKSAERVASGYIVKLGTEFTGVGGNVRYLSNSISGNYFIPLTESGAAMLKLEAMYGAISKIGYMRFKDQYFIGGYRFPGFSESGIGPRDIRTQDCLGGRQYYIAAAKFYFPLGLPKELAVKGIAYIQTGSLWSSMFKDDKTNYIVGAKFENRVSAGAGIMWTLPFVGKIGAIFSKALMKKPYDIRETFLLLWGQEF